jgi:hypothetical protein
MKPNRMRTGLILTALAGWLFRAEIIVVGQQALSPGQNQAAHRWINLDPPG